MDERTADRFLVVLTRIADALDRAIPIAPPELSSEELAELERTELAFQSDESFADYLAMVELLEERGEQVPDAAYRKVGKEPPNGRKLAEEPDERTLSADQPGTIQPSEPLEPSEPTDPTVGAPVEPPDEQGIRTTRKPGL